MTPLDGLSADAVAKIRGVREPFRKSLVLLAALVLLALLLIRERWVAVSNLRLAVEFRLARRPRQLAGPKEIEGHEFDRKGDE